MATRIYLPSTGSAPVTPGAFAAGWNQTTSNDVLRAVLVKIASSMTSKTTANSSSVQNILNRQYVFGPLKGGTISGNVKGQLRGLESNAGMDGVVAFACRIIKPDLSDRGVLLAVTSPALSGNEYTTSLVNRNSLVSTAITSQTAQDGDYLVLEFGCRQNAVSTNRTVSQSFGDDSGTDLPEDQTTTAANNPWVEFTATFNLLTTATTNKEVSIGRTSVASFPVTADSSVQVSIGRTSVADFPVTATSSTQVGVSGSAAFTITTPGSNYAISFAGSAYSRLGDEGSPITDIKNATALGVTCWIRGDTLKNIAASRPLLQVAAGYLAIEISYSSGSIVFDLVSAGLTFLHTDPPITLSGLDETGMYKIRAWRDNSASPKFGLEIFKPDDTLLDDVTASPADVTISNGTYGDFSLNFDGNFGASTEAAVFDWAALWDRIPPGAGSAPTEPTVGATGLLHLLRCNEGSGTILDDASSATDATLTGSYSWISLGGAGVTADSSVSVSVSATSVASFAVTADSSKVVVITPTSVASFPVTVDSSKQVSVTPSSAATLETHADSSQSTNIASSAVATVEIHVDSSQSVSVASTAIGSLETHAETSQAVPVVGSADAVLEKDATTTASVPISGSATGTLETHANSAHDVPVQSSAVASFGVTADSSKDVSVVSAATASFPVTADGSSEVPVGGSADFTISTGPIVEAETHQQVPVGGSADAVLETHADSSKDVPVGLNGHATIDLRADSSRDVPVGGSGVARVDLRAASSHQVTIGGESFGVIVTHARSIARADITGEAFFEIEGEVVYDIGPPPVDPWAITDGRPYGGSGPATAILLERPEGATASVVFHVAENPTIISDRRPTGAASSPWSDREE